MSDFGFFLSALLERVVVFLLYGGEVIWCFIDNHLGMQK